MSLLLLLLFFRLWIGTFARARLISGISVGLIEGQVLLGVLHWGGGLDGTEELVFLFGDGVEVGL